MALLKNDRLVKVVSYIFVGIMCVFTIYPVLYTILGSFKTNLELTVGGSLFPKRLMLDNYVEAFIKGQFTQYTLNSIILSSSVTILATLTAAMSGFVFSRYKFWGRKFFLTLFISLMFIHLGAITMYPTYRVLRTFHMTGSLLGLIISMVGGQTTNILLIMGFSNSVPRELDEAAIIDGCNMYQILFRIIFPLLRPILAVVALFAFRGAWNEYVWTLIMSASNNRLKTLTVGVVQLRYAGSGEMASWHLMVAGSAIALIPILIVYAFAHRQFISGLTAGSVKG